MSAWAQVLDSWCFEHADCNLYAFKTADNIDPALVRKFVEFVGSRVPSWATHFAGPPKDWTNFTVNDETVPVTLLEEIRR